MWALLHWGNTSLTLFLKTFLISSLILLLLLPPYPLLSYVPTWTPSPRDSLHTSSLPYNPLQQLHKVGLVTSQGPTTCQEKYEVLLLRQVPSGEGGLIQVYIYHFYITGKVYTWPNRKQYPLRRETSLGTAPVRA